MAIKVTCPNGHALQVKDKYAGQWGLCPHCQARVLVPKPEQVSEDEVAAMLGPPRTPSASPPAAEQFVHQDPRHDDAREESGVSLLGTAALRRKKVCPQCCNIASVAAALCPHCRTPLLTCTAPPTGEELPQPAKSTCHYLGVRKEGGVTVIRFGEHRILDQAAVDKIGNELYRVADRADCRNLLLNFVNVIGLSSLMLGNMLMLLKKMESKGGKLKLCQVGPEIQEVFAATKLGQIFEVCPSERDALRAFAEDAAGEHR